MNRNIVVNIAVIQFFVFLCYAVLSLYLIIQPMTWDTRNRLRPFMRVYNNTALAPFSEFKDISLSAQKKQFGTVFPVQVQNPQLYQAMYQQSEPGAMIHSHLVDSGAYDALVDVGQRRIWTESGLSVNSSLYEAYYFRRHHAAKWEGAERLTRDYLLDVTVNLRHCLYKMAWSAEVKPVNQSLSRVLTEY